MTGVNTLFNALLHAPGFAALDFSSLRVVMGGGMAVQRDVATRWQAVTGVLIAQGYGLTEASPIVSGNAAAPQGVQRLGRRAVPVDGGRDLRRRRPRARAPARSARSARAARKSWPAIGSGPTKRRRSCSATAGCARATSGGSTRTGILFIEDRKKDVIVVSGFKVYPNEIEDVATLQDGVREAAAIGVPDAQSGEVVKLFVVRSDEKLTAADVLAHARRSLTGYKVPRHVEFLDELPKIERRQGAAARAQGARRQRLSRSSPPK